MLLGANVSVAGTGLLRAVEESASYRADTYMIYTRSNRGGPARPIEAFNRDEARERMREHDLVDPVVHLSYLVNLASAKPETFEYGTMILSEEIARVEYLGFRYIVMHPGSHVGTGVDAGIARIAQGLNEVLTGREDLWLCLETMAGDGSKVGTTLEEIARIIDSVQHSEKLAVCIDTCHNYSAGYDIVNDFDGFLEKFDRIIGLERLRVAHINDSKWPLGSRKDRHENVGRGTLGLAALRKIVRHRQLANIPLILETPGGHYAHEIAMLRGETDELPPVGAAAAGDAD
ncbi:MAG: deoxyribonuclease IV [Firmicutes bacterium]|nr:deoxyribonuclease IV [Bacillota bacterium]